MKMHDGSRRKNNSSNNSVKSNCLRHGITAGPDAVSARKEQDMAEGNGSEPVGGGAGVERGCGERLVGYAAQADPTLRSQRLAWITTPLGIRRLKILKYF